MRRPLCLLLLFYGLACSDSDPPTPNPADARQEAEATCTDSPPVSCDFVEQDCSAVGPDDICSDTTCGVEAECCACAFDPTTDSYAYQVTYISCPSCQIDAGLQ